MVFLDKYIIDDGDVDGGFYQQGGWYTFNGQGYNNAIHRAAAGTGIAVATWSQVLNPNYFYQILATWTPHENRATNAIYRVYLGDGGWISVVVNQQLEPGAHWYNLGVYETKSTVIQVQLDNNANGYVCADAIMIRKILSDFSGVGFTPIASLQ